MRKLWRLMSPAERRKLPFVLFVMLAMAGVEVVGVAAAAAFIALLTDAGAADHNRWLGTLRDTLGTTDQIGFISAAGVVLFVVIVIRNAYASFAVWVRLSFLQHMRKTMATRLMENYLAKPFAYFQNANSATLTKNLAYEVNQLVAGNLYAWLSIIADTAITLALIGLLVWSDPLITLVAGAGLGVLAFGYLGFMRKRIQGLGVRSRQANDDIYRASGEAFGGVKELKVLGRERYFIDRFFAASHRFAKASVAFSLLNEVPRYVLEVIVIGGLLCVALLTLERSGSMAQVTETIALFVVAFYRILPIVHRLVTSFSGLNFNRAILDDLVNVVEANAAEKVQAAVGAAMPFEREIRLENVRFRYEGAPGDVLAGVSLSIPKNGTIALVGATGAGKTTLVDLVLGLLQPTGGRLLIDGQPLTPDNARSWQRHVGYVPQSIFLADASIRANIALGVVDEEIDDAQLARAASLAKVDEFVRDLPQGYGTMIGERGIRLSGGQRQRIGIARALYHEADVLVLDEATSALDGITEAVIEEALKQLAGVVTVVTIAHRLTTVRGCDRIYVMEQGRIVASGRYDELIAGNEIFRAMARMPA